MSKRSRKSRRILESSGVILRGVVGLGSVLVPLSCSLLLDTDELHVSPLSSAGTAASAGIANLGEGGSTLAQGGTAGATFGGSAGSNVVNAGNGGLIVTAGSAGAGTDGASDDLFIIDDMEDGDPRGRILSTPATVFFGYWYADHDTTAGTQWPGPPFQMSTLAAEERAGSKYAARTYGSGFTDWGAIIGIAMADGGTPFDASAFCSVHFWARGEPRSALIEIGDRFTDEGGGICSETGTDPYPCYWHAVLPFTITSTWTAYEFEFTKFKHYEGPSTPDLDKSELHSIQFTFRGPAAFDLWIDDLAFRVCK